MKKSIFKYRFIPAILMVIFLLVACTTDSDETETFTVTFDSQGGSSVASQTVEKDKTADEPDAPTKPGCSFQHWYTDDKEKFNFSTKITADITLYASWKNNLATKIEELESSETISVIGEIDETFIEEIKDALLVLATTDANSSSITVTVNLDFSYATGITSFYSDISGGGLNFSNCTTLKEIILPSSLTSIGTDVFHGCTSLESVTVSSGPTVIGARLFYGCTSLETVIIPTSVTSIGASILDGCTQNKLTRVTYEGTLEKLNNITIADTNEMLKKLTIIYGTAGTSSATYDSDNDEWKTTPSSGTGD